MTTRLEVELHGRRIGALVDGGGEVSFQFHPSYWDDPDRPVLGQWFEDGRTDEVYRGPGVLPAFFANLEPEGALGRWLAHKNALGAGALELLGVAGDDLPGALRLIGVEGPTVTPRSAVHRPPSPTPSFALAGVQLKLPMSLDRDDRLTLPRPGERAEWLAKVPMAGRYRDLVANESATMNWAREAGFVVAEVQVHPPPPALEREMGVEPANVESVLLVRRYDRTARGPIHQEDLAQATWLDPSQKYPRDRDDAHRFDAESEGRRGTRTTVEGLGRYVARLLGPEGFEEYLRRFVFVVASGNGDAHLKNWSVQYVDRRHPEWTPLYDQVSTVAWHDQTLACPLYGVRNFAGIHLSALQRMAVEAGSSDQGTAERRAEEIVAETIELCRAAFPAADAARGHVPDHRARLMHHWDSVPLLRSHGSLARTR